MKSRANPALIGGFVLGAIALAVAAVVVLGTGNLFKERVELVAFFPGSVNGLSVGAPVKFKGVEIGRVRRILLSVDEAYRTDFHIPVFFDLDPAKMTQQGAAVSADELRDREVLQALYETGLRAQLEAESLVTGVLYVELDMHPGTPYELQLDDDSELLEVPTLPTTLEQATSALGQILDKLEEVDFTRLMTSLGQTVEAVESLVTSPELRDLAANLNRTLDETNGAIADVRRLAQSARGNVDDLTASLEDTIGGSRDTLRSLDATLVEARETLGSVSGLVDADSPVVYQMGATLDSLDEAARSVRRLADSLERNPSVLVFGRSPEEDEE